MILHTSLSTSVLSCTSRQPPVSASQGDAQSSYTPNISLLTTAKVTTLRARTGAATKLTLGACMDTMQRQAGKRYGSQLNQSQLLLSGLPSTDTEQFRTLSNNKGHLHMQLHRSELQFTCTRTAVRLANRDLLLRAILLVCDCVGGLGCVLEGTRLSRGRQHLLPAVQVSAAKTC